MKGLVGNEVNVIARDCACTKERAPAISMGSHAERGAESTKSLQNKNTEQNLGVWCR